MGIFEDDKGLNLQVDSKYDGEFFVIQVHKFLYIWYPKVIYLFTVPFPRESHWKYQWIVWWRNAYYWESHGAIIERACSPSISKL